VRRGDIGVRAQTITPVLAAGLGLGRDQGAVLADVVPGSTADRAGLAIGDIVLALDGKSIENGRQLQVNLYRRPVGEVIRVDVLRGGKSLTVMVPVAERFDPLSQTAAALDPRENVISRLGILALTLDPALANAMGPLRSRSGVIVATASEGAFDAEGDGLVPGDVIHALNGQWITTLAGLRTAIDSIKTGEAVALQVERHGVVRYVAFVVD